MCPSVGPSVRRSVGRSVRNLFFRRAETKTANDLCRVSGLVYRKADADYLHLGGINYAKEAKIDRKRRREEAFKNLRKKEKERLAYEADAAKAAQNDGAESSDVSEVGGRRR